MNDETVNLIPAEVSLRDLVVLIDMHSTVLVNPAEIYPQLVAAVGAVKARWMWAAALLIVTVRDECATSDCGPGEMLPGVAAVAFALAALLLADGSARTWLFGAASALVLVALCHRAARAYREGEL